MEGDDVVVAVDGEVRLPVNKVNVNLVAIYQLVPHIAIENILDQIYRVVKVKR